MLINFCLIDFISVNPPSKCNITSKNLLRVIIENFFLRYENITFHIGWNFFLICFICTFTACQQTDAALSNGGEEEGRRKKFMFTFNKQQSYELAFESAENFLIKNNFYAFNVFVCVELKMACCAMVIKDATF